MNDLPPLTWLRAFEASARHRNFTAAAEALGLTPAAISYQVRALEEHLGYPLFSRKKRPMELTTMGQLYLPWVIKSFDVIRQGTTDVFGVRETRPVRIRCLPSFALIWLMQRLPQFREQYPEVKLQLHIGTWASAIDTDQLDIELRFGDGDWPGHQAHFLQWDPILPLCRPDLRPANGSMEELAKAPLIEIIGVADNWRQFFRQENVEFPAQTPALQADQSIAALEMASLGLGHALVSRFFAEPYLADGRLIQSVPLEKRSERALYMTCPEGPVSFGSQAFQDWILAQFQ